MNPFRYSRLGYCRLQVTNLDRSIAFYRDLVGMTLERTEGGSAWLRCSDKPYDLILQEGQPGGLAGVGFELESEADLEKAFAHVKTRGHAPAWNDAAYCAAQQVARSFRLRNRESGLEIDFYVGQAIAAEPYTPSLTQIARLGHVVLNVGDLAAAHRFWCDDLGFAVSDRVEGVAEWLRCWPNPLHHSLALIGSGQNTLHHINFMVTDIDDIGKAMNRMQKAEVSIVFGPGRHLPSTSIFLYFLDPDGNTTEYSFGMELFDETGARGPRELEHRADVMDIWGGRPDPRFGKGGAIIAA